MNLYKIMLEVINLSMLDEDSGKLMDVGCFCTKYIKDDSFGAAIIKAKKLVLSELNEKGIDCLINQISIETSEKIVEIPADAAGKEFTFYPMEDA
jgi:hypothetical protein